MPDLMGFLSKFGEVTSFYDANGHYARVSTAQANIFHYCAPGDTNSRCTGGGGRTRRASWRRSRPASSSTT